MLPHKTDQTVTPTERTIKMNSGSTFIAPVSWKMEAHENYVQVIAPENDVTLYFLEFPATQNLEKIATDAWRQVQPYFDLKPSQELFLPTTSGWKKSQQIVYDTPTSESRFVSTMLRTYKDKAYLCLIDAKMAGLSRRGAELHLMYESWKPVGFKKNSLHDREAKNWADADSQDFEKFISDAMQKLKIPGAAIAIVRQDGKMLYKKAFGVKKMGLDDPITLNTPFMIGSTTKPLTSLLMAMLVDQKKLSWETPVTQVLKNFSLADSEITQKLNIRHTVSASTGMPVRVLDWIFKYKGIKPEDRLLQMKNMKPTTGFGEIFQYSNYLVMAGGYAAARAYVSNGDLENAYALAMQQLVFDHSK